MRYAGFSSSRWRVPALSSASRRMPRARRGASSHRACGTDPPQRIYRPRRNPARGNSIHATPATPASAARPPRRRPRQIPPASTSRISMCHDPRSAATSISLVAQGFTRDRLTALFAAAEPQPRIIDAISRPAEKTLQWWEYRARVLTPERIDAGVQLWREHKELLDQIAIEYQVSPEYLIAVLGVETRYGRVTGRYRVIDALATLAFDYPPRASYFRKELTEFLLLAREEKFDPLSIRGSYAGAMGALQFMPSSYRKFAVSEQHAPHRDLWGDWGDIFASTANYLHQSGWQYGRRCWPRRSCRRELGLVAPEHMALNDTLGDLRTRGMTVASELPDDTPALLLAAPQQDAYGYRVGFKNFYVITRYNNSPLYAMAVYDLAQAIVQQIAQESAL